MSVSANNQEGHTMTRVFELLRLRTSKAPIILFGDLLDFDETLRAKARIRRTEELAHFGMIVEHPRSRR
jgi:hypothetical protein